MTVTVTIHQAKTNLSKLIAAVEAGDEVLIARRDKVVARLGPADAVVAKPPRKPGLWKERAGYGFDDRFFEPLPDDELRLWNGEGD